jgi:hypothetical protein
MAVNHTFYCSPMMHLRTQIWLARAYYGCRRAMGKIGRLNTTRFYTEIGAGEVFR